MSRMIRIFWVAIIVCFMLVSIFQMAYAQKKTFKLGHIYPTTNPIGRGAEIFKKVVEDNSGGRLTIEVYPNQQLGGLRQLEDNTRMGIIELCYGATATFSTIHEPTAIWTLPYTFRDADHLYRVVRGNIGTKIYNDMIAKTGARVISTFYEPLRHVTSNVRIGSAADCKGLKIRVSQTPPWIAYWKKLGASPMPIDLGEVYTSLQAGLVVAQENPYIMIHTKKFYEVQKYLIPLGYVRELDWFMINNKVFEALPKDLQEVVLQAGKAAEDLVNKEWPAEDESAGKDLITKGMQLVTGVDQEPFRKAAKEFYKEFLKQRESQELYENIQALK